MIRVETITPPPAAAPPEYPLPRAFMYDPGSIAARMGADMARLRALGVAVETRHLIEEGWTSAQIATHEKAAIDRAVLDTALADMRGARRRAA